MTSMTLMKTLRKNKMAIKVGSIIPGYCNGYFGRDSYETKRVEAMGADWIVCRDDDGHIHFASGLNIIRALEEYLEQYPEKYEENT